MKTHQPDLVCYGKIIVEIKAVSELTDEHRVQVHNDLKATGYRLGLPVNSGAHGERRYERIVR
jgi:GxxExxY protein